MLPSRWWFPASYSRLLDPIPSVPDLRAYILTLAAAAALVPVSQFRDAWQALEDAEWRLAVESHRWCQRRPFVRGEVIYWLSQCTVEALRFEERLSGYRVPGKELALRPKMEACCGALQ